jgi:hypothetical protein
VKLKSDDVEAILLIDFSFFCPDHSQDRSTELEIVQKLKDCVRKLSGELANVHFSYRDPERNFDRSKVKGVVARLIRIKDSSTATALEVRISKLISACLKLILVLTYGVGLVILVQLLVKYCRLLQVGGYLMWWLTQKKLESNC